MNTTHGTPPVVPPNATSPERKGRFWIGFGAGCLTSLVLALMLAGVLLIGSLVPAIGAARAAARTARGQAAAAPQGGDEALTLEELEIEGALENEDYDRAEEIARALESRSGTPEAHALVFMVRIERAVAAEDARSADALVTECRELGLPVDPSSELGVAGLWLDDDEPAKCRAIAERVLLGEFDADEYGRYLRGTALVLRGLASAELGDADAGAKDITEAISLAPDEETADEWQGYLDEVRERTR